MPQLLESYTSGSTEPWTAQAIVGLMQGVQAKRVLELGSFIGLTTKQLLGGLPLTGSLDTVEFDPDRFETVKNLFAHDTRVTVWQQDVIDFLELWAGPPFDFVFVDDDHKAKHVALELDTLIARKLVRPGGLIVVHDVCGPFSLDHVVRSCGGFILDLPKLHAAGGLGIIQR